MCSTIWEQQPRYHGNILSSRPPQNKRHFWPPMAFRFDICKWCLICLIQPAYKDVSSRFWPHLIFYEMKITGILKSSEWGLEKSELLREHNLYSCRCVSCRPIGLPSCNGLRCKLTKISLFIYLKYTWYKIGTSVWRHQSPFACFTHFSNLNIFGTKTDICKW